MQTMLLLEVGNTKTKKKVIAVLTPTVKVAAPAMTLNLTLREKIKRKRNPLLVVARVQKQIFQETQDPQEALSFILVQLLMKQI